MKNTKGKIACWCLAILAAVAVVAGIFCYVADLNIHAGELDLLASTEDILLGGADEMYYQGSYEADSLDNYDNGENDLVTENIEEDEILLEYNSETTDLLELDNSEDTSDILLEEADNTEELLLEESEDTTDLLLEESDVETELLLEEQSDDTEMLLEEGEDVTALLLEESLSGNELQTEEQDDILSVSENGILSGKFALKGASSDIKIEIGENGDNVYGILSEAGELRIFGSGSTKVYYTSDKRPGFDEYKDKILKVICDDSIEVTDDPESGIKFSQVLFNECKNLEEVDLNGKVYAIDGYVFNGCSSLKTVTGLERVVSMGTASFKGCRNLESIEDTGNVGRIDSAAFYDCRNV